jgi:hypothetical protein
VILVTVKQLGTEFAPSLLRTYQANRNRQ